MSELVKTARRYMSELVDLLENSRYRRLAAAGILGLMLVYILGGMVAVLLALVSIALVLLAPRIKRRLTKWYLLR